MLAFTKDGKTLVATNRGSDSVSIFELTASDPLFPGAWKETIVVDLTQKKMTASFDLGRPRQMIVPPIRPNFHSYGWAAGPYGTHLRNCPIEVSECNRDLTPTDVAPLVEYVCLSKLQTTTKGERDATIIVDGRSRTGDNRGLVHWTASGTSTK